VPDGDARVRARSWRCCLFGFTCLYRFNTLGGRFGGFDNDHFVPFAYAKQVQAGEQPLRDFDGLGLQGAWPSLTYETSALTQRWFGDNLRSEALLTVTAVGVAAALTFLAAASITPVAWAAAATLVSVFVAPTLYNYPKVLMLSAAALTIARYCGRPHAVGVVVGSVVTASHFCFVTISRSTPAWDCCWRTSAGALAGNASSGRFCTSRSPCCSSRLRCSGYNDMPASSSTCEMASR
jgi:hypothetical protein